MCGICGIYGLNLVSREIEVFRGLTHVNQFRGADSTGILRVDDKLNIRAIRATVPSGVMLASKEGREFVDHTTNPILYLAHCRAATIGSVIPQNVHPFSFPNVVGVHNGTIHGDFRSRKDYDTDSESLFKNINDHGLEEGIGESLEFDPQGAYALAFIDKKAATLNFIRNKNRPLHFTYISARSALIWSSTQEMIDFVLDHLSVLNSGWKTTDASSVWTLGENTLFTIDLGAAASTGVLSQRTIVRKLPPKAKAKNVYAGQDESWYDNISIRGEADFLAEPEKPGGKTTNPRSFRASDADDNVYVLDSDGNYRTRKQIEERYEKLFKANSSDKLLPSPEHHKKTKLTSADKKARRRAAKEQIDPQEDNDDMTHLAWLERENKADKSERFFRIAMAATGSKSDSQRPTTEKELRFRLSEGCGCCGTVVDPDDLNEVKRVRWWSREAYACGDCYEHSEGNWVKCSIEDDWKTEVAKKRGETVITVH